MNKRCYVCAGVLALLYLSLAGAQQYPVLDMVANKVIQKYQQASCEQLWQQKSQPKSAQEQKIIQLLKNDAQMRTAFINQVAGPVVNKMFDCGMVP